MKPQYQNLLFSILAVALSFVVKEYSLFLSGVLLGAGALQLITTGYRLLRNKAV